MAIAVVYSSGKYLYKRDLMKFLAWIILAAGILYYMHGSNDFAVPQQSSAQRSGKGISHLEFMEIFNAQKSFSDLTSENYYTVVEVYLDTCAICKRLEKGYDQFLDRRRDVLIKKVHFPESGISFLFTSEDMMEDVQSRIESYRVCGTPHIEIFGPDGTLVSADDCTQKQGSDFLRYWISKETGIPRQVL